MKILKTSIDCIDEEIITEAIRVLADGGVVLYPTDTVYGLGANIFNKNAVKKVYDILKETGHNKAEIKLYPGARHEILNETNRDEVMDDIINFADKALNL